MKTESVDAHLVGVGLYGQSRIDRKDFEKERQLTLKGVLHLGTQAGWVVGDPLAQGGLWDPVVFNLGIAFRVGTHPQLEKKTSMTSRSLLTLRSIRLILLSIQVQITKNSLFLIAEIYGLVL